MKKTAARSRVYEYVDGDGNTYWSLTKSQNIISPPTRLVLQDRKGEHPMRFITRLRQTITAILTDSLPEDDG